MGLKDRLMELPEDCFEALSFGELEVGDKYIGFPLPGDEGGHGGYRGSYYLFEKIGNLPDLEGEVLCNSQRCMDRTFYYMPDSWLVIKVE